MESCLTEKKALTLTNIELISTELSRLEEMRPTLNPQTVRLVSLLTELWDSYITECARNRDLQMKWHMLQSSNNSLKGRNSELESICIVRGGVIRGNQQALQSVREGVLSLFQSMHGYQTFLSSCN